MVLHWRHGTAPAALAGAGGAAGAAVAAACALHMLLSRLPRCFTIGEDLQDPGCLIGMQLPFYSILDE